MAYIVQQEFFNGYRCSCCYRSWESTEIVSTLKEALKYVPTENEGGGDAALESVKVTDGATGDLVAWGRLSYPHLGRYSGYRITRWVGWRNGETFDSAGSDAEWEAQLLKVREDIYQKELADAQANLVAAQEKLSQLQQKS